MSLTIAGLTFEGPYSIDTTTIPANRAAIYAIVAKRADGKSYVIDVGESGEVGVRLAQHDRRSCWARHAAGQVVAYLHYMPSAAGYTAAQRRQLETRIRSQYRPPCGAR